jgi:hypothetical protein
MHLPELIVVMMLFVPFVAVMVLVPFVLFMLPMLPSMPMLPVGVRIGRIVGRWRHVSRSIVRIIFRISVGWRSVRIPRISWIIRFIETRR